jgi:hypothetical protein
MYKDEKLIDRAQSIPESSRLMGRVYRGGAMRRTVLLICLLLITLPNSSLGVDASKVDSFVIEEAPTIESVERVARQSAKQEIDHFTSIVGWVASFVSVIAAGLLTVLLIMLYKLTGRTQREAIDDITFKVSPAVINRATFMAVSKANEETEKRLAELVNVDAVKEAAKKQITNIEREISSLKDSLVKEVRRVLEAEKERIVQDKQTVILDALGGEDGIKESLKGAMEVMKRLDALEHNFSQYSELALVS